MFVIAKHNFRDEEYEEPRKTVESEGAQITVASSSTNEARGMFGLKVTPDILLQDVRVEDYHAVFFVGGSGAAEYWNNPAAHDLARAFYNMRKITSAISTAPVTLANAGLLNGRRATVYPSYMTDLKSGGAKYTAMPVEIDGRLITADGPESAKDFGRKLVEALKNQ